MRTESQFNGVCIGGPWDGRMVANTSPTLAVVKMPEPSVLVSRPYGHTLPDEITVSVERSIYDHVPLTHVQGVWVHESLRRKGVGLSVIAVEALIHRYAGP